MGRQAPRDNPSFQPGRPTEGLARVYPSGMLWIAVGLMIAMMVGVVFPKKPLKLDLKSPPPPPPPET